MTEVTQTLEERLNSGPRTWIERKEAKARDLRARLLGPSSECGEREYHRAAEKCENSRRLMRPPDFTRMPECDMSHASTHKARNGCVQAMTGGHDR